MNSKILILLSMCIFSMTMVLASTPTLIFPDSFADTNASTECSGDEVLLGNGSCQSTASYGGGGSSDGNASSICGDNTYLNGNGDCDLFTAMYTDINMNDADINNVLDFDSNNDFDFYPSNQFSIGLRLNNDTNGMTMQVLGGSRLTLNTNDDLYVKGNAVSPWLYNQTTPAINYCDATFIPLSDLPLANRTLPHCSNITGATSDLCTITGGGGNPFDQDLNTTHNVIFNQVNITGNQIHIDGTGGTFGDGLISFANSTGGHNQFIEMYDDGIWIASGGEFGWVQILGDLSLWDDIQPMVILGGIPDTWYNGWFGVRDNLTVQDTIFTTGLNATEICFGTSDCATTWPSGGGASDGNASSICGADEFLDGDGDCVDHTQYDTGGHTTDTNETTRFTRLVDTACGSNEYVYDVHVNGTVLCRNDGLNGSSVSSGKKEIFFPSTVLSPEGEIAAEGTSIDVQSMSSTGSFRLNFFVPNDFTSMTGLYVVVVPDATETIQYDLSGSHASAGELVTNSEQDSLNVQTAVTDNTIQDIDVSEVFSGLGANDYAGLEFKSDTSNIRVLGVRLKYD
jgi:hypothetical protein